MNVDTRMEIAEKIHNIQDILRGSPDPCLTRHCEKMLDRLDVLAALEIEYDE